MSANFLNEMDPKRTESAPRPVEVESPDKIFERRWALTLLDQVLSRLEEEFSTAGKDRQFARLSGYLIDNREMGTYEEAARDLGLSEEAVKKAVQRMRRRFGELTREEVSQTAATPEEVEEELRYLCEIISVGPAL